MAIKFNVHEIGNPVDPAAPKKFYARPVHSGEIDLEALATDISHSSSINEPDVYAVLRALVREVPRNISRGYIVRLGQLGSFRLAARSTGSERAEDVSSANIVHPRLYFHAGKRVKAMLEEIEFKKQSS